ncbi:MAG: TonB-dependent receptor [Bacteroidales bacterium]|nr:TonB-dependent receptor [Bacteroidales bacterium]
MRKTLMMLFAVITSINMAIAQQKFSISGTVNNDKNEPLIGANVYLNGTTIGTATNNIGEFTIKNIKEGNYELCVSYLGYKRYRTQINLNKAVANLNIIMQESEGELGEIVVTATGTPHHLKTAPVPTELVTKKMIERIAAPDFAGLMTNISPSFDFSPGTMGSFIQLNGLGNDFIVILIDGRRVYGDMGGLNDLGRINPNNVERIEVVKGASSSLYGSDAIAGVINIITKKSKSNISVTNNTQVSNYNTYEQTNNIDFKSGIVSGHTSFSQKQSDGWQNSKFELTKKGELIDTKVMTQNAYINRNIRQDLELRLTDKIEVNGGGSFYINHRKQPLEVKDYGYYFEDLSYNFGAKYLISKKSNIKIDYNSDDYKYYYKYNQDDEKGKFNEGDYILNSDQRRQDVNLKWMNKLNKSQTITAGAEMVNESYVSDGRLTTNEAKVNTWSIYAQDEITLFNDLLITAGIRAVKHDNFGAIATPKISLLYKLKNINLRGTYSSGFKAPTLKEQYYYYIMRGTLYLGNTELDAQKSDYYSVGVDYHNSWLNVNLSSYQNDVKGLITYKAVNTIPGDAENGIKARRQHYNIEDARTRGVELMFDAKLPYGFTIGGGYSYVDAKNLTEDIRLEYVAQNYGSLRAGYFHGWKKYQLNVQLLGRLQDEKFFTDGNAKAYQLWRLTTTHDFAEFSGINITANAGIDNIFNFIDDSPYGLHRGTINPGRTYFVGLNIKFSSL